MTILTMPSPSLSFLLLHICRKVDRLAHLNKCVSDLHEILHAFTQCEGFMPEARVILDDLVEGIVRIVINHEHDGTNVRMYTKILRKRRQKKTYAAATAGEAAAAGGGGLVSQRQRQDWYEQRAWEQQ